MRIIDVSTPAAPAEVGSFDTVSYAYKVQVIGGTAYVADVRDGLRVFDVSDPTSPAEIGFFNTNGMAFGLQIAGNKAFVGDGPDGVRVIDVSDPAAPAEVGWYDTGDFARGLFVTDDFIYLADAEDGVYIFKNEILTEVQQQVETQPADFELAQNYPNPFNPSTTIGYALPKSGHVRITIYDLLGRHVRTLVDSRQSAGRFLTLWDGRDENNMPVAAGVYFYKMEAGDPSTNSPNKTGQAGQRFVQVNKLVLVR